MTDKNLEKKKHNITLHIEEVDDTKKINNDDEEKSKEALEFFQKKEEKQKVKDKNKQNAMSIIEQFNKKKKESVDAVKAKKQEEEAEAKKQEEAKAKKQQEEAVKAKKQEEAVKAAAKEILDLEEKLLKLKEFAAKKSDEEEEEEWEKELLILRQLNANQWSEGLKTNFQDFPHTKIKFDEGDLRKRAQDVTNIFRLATSKSVIKKNIEVVPEQNSTIIKTQPTRRYVNFMRF